MSTSPRVTHALVNMRNALQEFTRIEATDATGEATANAGIGLAMAVGDYLAAIDRSK